MNVAQVNTFIGTFGHAQVVLAFVAALVATYAFWKASTLSADPQRLATWKTFARRAFLVHSVAVIGVIITLFLIIYNRYYEYHYAWSHSSNNLPVHYMISCFWEGQEGSFLLWIFWHVLLGWLLIRTARQWEFSVMTVFSLVQAFLVSMILGVVIADLKIGSSPFMLLRDVMDAPIFRENPNFIPADGTGINPLLQNYWMVIHPPTLFLGFALTLVPFAFCIAGLRERKYKEWIAPTMPWAAVAGLILGLGIMMGAYWAYETLNFGGYWNWDPVENAVYIPWLTLVASLHLMSVHQRSGRALKVTMIMTVVTFILILYSTFLTRSGVLGESSVHSFTDLGLSGQLLIYLLAFAFIAAIILAMEWKNIPTKEGEASSYSGEFWVFMGALVLSLAAFQVLLPTSIPVYNAFLRSFGIASNMAPPADQVGFYTKFQLWFGVGIAILSATGQVFWWKRLDAKSWKDALYAPLMITFGISALVIIIAGIQDVAYIVLLTASVYSLAANGMILSRFFKGGFRLAGGAITHIGVALMLIGILFSSGYSKTVSLNTTGLLYNREFPEEMNRENLLLFRGQPQRMGEFTLLYKGPRVESRDLPFYINKEDLLPTNDPFKVILKEDVVIKGQTYGSIGDTVHVYAENTYYEIEYTQENGRTFTLFPRVQMNPEMGGGSPVVSPDIRKFWDVDLYTHVTNIPDPLAEAKWSEPEVYNLTLGDTFFVNDFVAVLDNVVRQERVAGVELAQGDVAVQANIRILGRNVTYDAKPLYIIKDQKVGMAPEMLPDLGIKIQFEKIDPATQTFTFSAQTTQKDWIILKAVEKPWINILWIGTLVMLTGFGISTWRRYQEFAGRHGKTKTAASPTYHKQTA